MDPHPNTDTGELRARIAALEAELAACRRGERNQVSPRNLVSVATEQIAALTQYQEAVIDNAEVYISAMDTQCNVLIWNAAAERITGYTRAEVLGNNRIYDWLYPEPETRQAVLQTVCELLDEHKRGEAAFLRQLRCRDGQLRTLSFHSRRLRDAEGRAIGYVNVGVDITEQRRVREELAEERNLLRMLIDALPDAIYLKDAAGRFVICNTANARLQGFEAPDDLVGKSAFDVDPPELAERYAAADRQVMESGVPIVDLEEPIADATGELRWFSTTKVPRRDAEGNVVGIVGISRDITDRKHAEQAQARLQAQLLQSQKMEAIGRLTAGIAHDFNNLLTVINGFAELLKMHLPPEADAGGYTDKIITAGQRAASLVSKLMAFGRKQMLQPRVVDLNEIVAGMGALLHRLIGEDIALQTQLAEEPWPVKVDPTQIEQVIVNLAVNARDAMPTGGRLVIESSNVTLVDEQPPGVETRPPGDYARLTIADSGSGMSTQVKAHLFEPFFTTKPLGQGTGLGLATVYGIVRQSGGYIEVTSNEGQGTRFDIYLPRADETAPALSRQGTGPLAPVGAETVLVVEDDAAVRRLAADVLRDRGYNVLEAADAAAALRLAGEYDGAIHLLLSDVVMPGASGKELAAQLSALRRGLKVILMSGYSGDMIAGRGGLPPGIEFVQKPISASELARRVRMVLDRE
jgi:PAS domain S-box-containing protein